MCLRSNGENEYFSGQLIGYLQTEGILREFSYKYMPQLNGVAKRKNRTIAEAARTMLEEQYMPKSYWAEAVSTTVYLLHWTPVRGAQVTPHEQ